MTEKTFEEKYNELLQEYDAKVTIPNWFISGIKTLLDKNVTIEDWNRTYSYLEALVSDDVVLLKLLKLLKSEVSTLETNKLDKSTTPSTLYAVGLSGLQEHIFYAHEPYPYSIPNRDADGQLKVPEVPTENRHATSKKYVDDKIAKKADKTQVDFLEQKIIFLEQQTPKTYMTMANDTLIVSGAVFEDDVMIVDGIKVENDILLI
jgi:hypothetical protein